MESITRTLSTWSLTHVALDEENDEGIEQILYLGWNRPGGTLLEVVVLHFDDGREMAIHAMKTQARYERYLPGTNEDA